jgi:hypothetical protein
MMHYVSISSLVSERACSLVVASALVASPGPEFDLVEVNLGGLKKNPLVSKAGFQGFSQLARLRSSTL